MVPAKLTLKNYRYFEDSNPLNITIEPGFTALVGANNSGKSSFLKMFFEQRELWGTFSNPASVVTQETVTTNPSNIHDPTEVFCNLNSRDIEIEVRVSTSHQNFRYLSLAQFTTQRQRALKWDSQFGYGPKHISLKDPKPKGSDEEKVVLQDGEAIDYSEFVEIMAAFRDCLYIGSFRNAINEGAGTYFDLDIGTSFVSTWNSWKVGTLKYQNLAITSITKDIADAFGFENLEINSSTDGKTLQVNKSNEVYKLSEVGSGLAQFIIVFGNAGIKRPSFILIDEPELNLHPSLQVRFLTSLAAYARYGVIFATHSIGLARAVSDRIYSFSVDGNRSIVRPFEQTPNYPEFLGELSFGSYRDLGNDHILLVEGVSDVRTVQQFLRMIHKDHRIVVLPLGGDQLASGGVEIELSELTRLSKNISALVDSERESSGSKADEHRDDFQRLCEKLGFKVCLTERRAMENYLTEGAVQSVYGPKYHALGFYDKLRDANPSWTKRENWKIARAMSWEDIRDTDVGKFLDEL